MHCNTHNRNKVSSDSPSHARAKIKNEIGLIYIIYLHAYKVKLTFYWPNDRVQGMISSESPSKTHIVSLAFFSILALGAVKCNACEDILCPFLDCPNTGNQGLNLDISLSWHEQYAEAIKV